MYCGVLYSFGHQRQCVAHVDYIGVAIHPVVDIGELFDYIVLYLVDSHCLFCFSVYITLATVCPAALSVAVDMEVMSSATVCHVGGNEPVEGWAASIMSTAGIRHG